MTREIASLDEMKLFAVEIAARLGLRALILLDGPMGAGKTQFTQFLVEALGGRETRSPSFAIHHSYPTKRGYLEHFDLFRLTSEDDLESTGFWDFFSKREGVIVIEWFARLSELGLERHLPQTWSSMALIITPDPAGDERRRVELFSK